MKYAMLFIVIVSILMFFNFQKKIEILENRIDAQNDAIINFMFNGDVDDTINYMLMKERGDGKIDVLNCIALHRQ